MLEVKVQGGLGNQMFQYAFSRYLASAGNEVLLNISEYNIHHYHNGFELAKVFGISEKCNLLECSFSTKQSSIVFRLFRKLFDVRVTNSAEYYENEEIPVPHIKYYANIFFIGVWGRLDYINSIEEEIREAFVFRQELTGKNLQLSNYLKRENTVSVHIRLGDYIGNANLGGVCDKKYYETALNIFNNMSSNFKYIIFSDDCKTARTLFSFPEDSIYVDWNKKEDSYIDMRLMSMCKHHILSNSTFSWWGGYLNPSKEKKVVIPRKPTRNTVYENNLLSCKGWIQI